ncbi:uncharacterized protein LOC111362244 [Spodoptera litura]|uniref:Uncharacterized protein LOC111362244 n=1 Tax=Spodoptera litura TaxID=69820 RepID=A0A9J7IYZ3_SPOLT|nr:uncharacterized protein LOC111362244 [Spodoptera litura]
MATCFDSRSVTGQEMNDGQISQILGDGNLSKIEDFGEDDDNFQRNVLKDLNFEETFSGMKSEEEPEFGDSPIGMRPSVVLHLNKFVPPGSCICHDRFFTTVALIEEHRRNLHGTGTIMMNRISDRAAIKFNTDARIAKQEKHFALIGFSSNIADGLSSIPSKERRMSSDIENDPLVENDSIGHQINLL